MSKTETRTATIYADENGILHIIMREDSRVDHEDALDNLLVVKTYTKGKKALKLIDATAKFKVEKKARELINSVDAKQTIARAVLKSSLISKMLLNFFNELNKHETPTKVFSDYDEAYKWLLIMKIRFSNESK